MGLSLKFHVCIYFQTIKAYMREVDHGDQMIGFYNAGCCSKSGEECSHTGICILNAYILDSRVRPLEHTTPGMQWYWLTVHTLLEFTSEQVSLYSNQSDTSVCSLYCTCCNLKNTLIIRMQCLNYSEQVVFELQSTFWNAASWVAHLHISKPKLSTS